MFSLQVSKIQRGLHTNHKNNVTSGIHEAINRKTKPRSATWLTCGKWGVKSTECVHIFILEKLEGMERHFLNIHRSLSHQWISVQDNLCMEEAAFASCPTERSACNKELQPTVQSNVLEPFPAHCFTCK